MSAIDEDSDAVTMSIIIFKRDNNFSFVQYAHNGSRYDLHHMILATAKLKDYITYQKVLPLNQVYMCIISTNIK